MKKKSYKSVVFESTYSVFMESVRQRGREKKEAQNSK